MLNVRKFRDDNGHEKAEVEPPTESFIVDTLVLPFFYGSTQLLPLLCSRTPSILLHISSNIHNQYFSNELENKQLKTLRNRTFVSLSPLSCLGIENMLKLTEFAY